MATPQVSFVKNLLVPAFGDTKSVKVVFPNSTGYEIDFNTIVIDDSPFQPQSVTVDATQVPIGQYVSFRVLDIDFYRIIKGGNTETFTFPSVRNLRTILAPSDAVSAVTAFFYNFPAFPDFSGSQTVDFSASSGLNTVVVSTPLQGILRNSVSVKLPTAATTGALNIVPAVAGQTIKVHQISVQLPGTTALAATNLIIRGSTSVVELKRVAINTIAGAGEYKFSPAIPFILTLADGVDYIYSAATTLTNPPIVCIDYEVF